MKCREFDRDCADWLRGRLSGERNDEMRHHEASCPSCAALARAERAILAAVRAEPNPLQNVDLWPKVLNRLEHGRPAPETRTWPWHRRVRFVWGLAGAAVALIGYMIIHPAGVDRTALVRLEDEARVVEMIAASEPVRSVEASASGMELSADFEIQRGLLVGNGN